MVARGSGCRHGATAGRVPCGGLCGRAGAVKLPALVVAASNLKPGYRRELLGDKEIRHTPGAYRTHAGHA